MARVLIVGCGCRGRTLAAALVAQGHAVRGTTRDPDRLGAIAAADAEAVVADPGRLATLLPHLEGVSLLAWLLGCAAGDASQVAALHGPRLQSLLDHLVDTPVRGFLYEAAGGVARDRLEQGSETVRRAAATHRIRIELLQVDPGDPDAWLAEATAAVERALR